MPERVEARSGGECRGDQQPQYGSINRGRDRVRRNRAGTGGAADKTVIKETCGGANKTSDDEF